MNEIYQPKNYFPALILLGLGAIPLLATVVEDRFLVAFIARVLIYALAASALNIALGMGGLVSFGHALFFGIGAYCVSLPVYYGITSGWIHLALTIVICSLIGGITGLVSLRTKGISFIMITLAFAQMGYFIIISLKQYGGDDGMSIATTSDFGLWRLDKADSVYLTTWFMLIVVTCWVWFLRNSPFGMILRASKQNSRRISSIGVPIKRYQLTAYVISSVLCGISGILMANLNTYASPSAMSWIFSGDLIVMVVLGGMGSVFGPFLGAFAFLGLEEFLKPLTDHWMMPFGLAIVAMGMLGTSGLTGALERYTHKTKASP